MTTELKTTVARIVWGNPLVAQQKKDPTTKQLILKDGQPVIQHVFGIAIPKAEFAATVWPAMNAEIRNAYPSGQTPSKFSWKYLDGDSIDSAGKPYSEREGYAGCYVLTVSSQTGFPPSVYKWNAAANNYDQVPADGIKTGDYVVVGLSLKVNVPTERTMTPGLYVNPQAIELVGYGKHIVSAGVDPMALFGGQQYQLPAGASTMPVSSAPAGVGMPGQMPMQPQQQQQPGQMPGMPGQMPMQPQQMPMQQPGQMPMQQPGQMPMQQYQQPAPMQQYQQPAPQQQQMPAPAHDFVQNAGMQQPGQMPMQPQQQPGQMPMQPQQQPGQMPGMPGQMPGR